MKSIWKALDKAHKNIPSHYLKAKQVLGVVIVNAKRSIVNKSLAVGWTCKKHTVPLWSQPVLCLDESITSVCFLFLSISTFNDIINT